VPDFLLTLLRLIFLSLVYLFVWQVARSMSTHIGVRPTRRHRRKGTRVVVVRSDTNPGLQFVVEDSVVLGRSEQADVIITDPYSSDFHLRMTSKDGRIVLSDLGSTNGTYVNGRRVTAPTELGRGDAVQVGKTVMEIR